MLPTPETNLASLLDEQGEAWAERLALAVPADRRARAHREVRYDELRARVRAVAAALHERGIGAGDAVVVMVPMSVELYAVLLGLFHVGAVAVFVDPWMARAGLERCVASVAPKLFVGSPAALLLRASAGALRRIPLAASTGFAPPGAERLAAWMARAGAPPPVAPVRPESVALVTLTTGSGGAPKGAGRSHGHLRTQQRILARHLGPAGGEADLPALPIFALNTLACGATAVIPALDFRRPAEVDPAVVLRQIERYGVAQITASPSFCAPLARHAARRGAALPVGRVFTGGAPVPLGLAEELSRLLPPGGLRIVYGCTEVEPVSILDGETYARALREAPAAGVCVGVPIPEARVVLLPERDGPLEAADVPAAEVPAGEAGEVVVSGPHVNPDYFRDPEAVRRHKIRDAAGRVWHRTGDVARRDEAGRLWLVGRVGASVRHAGRTLHPVAVERVAAELPTVRRAALVPGGPGRAVLVVEPRRRLALALPTGRARLRRLVRDGLDAAGLPPLDVRLTRRIPVDPRHRSKVDRRAPGIQS